MLALNTWHRETQLPHFFYNYFMETFMLPAYTCDKMRAQDLSYPGMSSTYSCYCNNGDYHAMPDLNFQITGKNFQYDMGPASYMMLPYINYTQPMSLCILGIDKAPPSSLPDELEYVSLGQRAMATFPFYAVFNRADNTALLELGNVTQIGGPTEFGLHLGLAIVIVVGTFIMLIYLIYLRKQRLNAEEWLDANRAILFSHAAKLKSEEEIL